MRASLASQRRTLSCQLTMIQRHQSKASMTSILHQHPLFLHQMLMMKTKISETLELRGEKVSSTSTKKTLMEIKIKVMTILIFQMGSVSREMRTKMSQTLSLKQVVREVMAKSLLSKNSMSMNLKRSLKRRSSRRKRKPKSKNSSISRQLKELNCREHSFSSLS